MTTILHIASSSNLHGSVTRQIGSVALDDLKQTYPDAKVIERDLIKNPAPHVSPEFLGAMFSGQNDAPALALSQELIDEIFAGDIIVLEVPMYNFGIPSALKAWIDHVVRAGKTFQYGAKGPEGLAKGKKVILVLGRGGVYQKWWGRKELQWFKPPTASYAYQGVEVAVNPELGLNIDGHPHIIKLYLKGEKLMKSRANIITGLMELTLREKAPDGGSICLLDARNAKMFSFTEDLSPFHAIIDGELAYIAAMWDRV